MTDNIDEATAINEEAMEKALVGIRRRANIPKGTDGECHECGEHSLRLVGGVCAYCRDGR